MSMTGEATGVSSLPAVVAFFSTPPSRLQSQLAKSTAAASMPAGYSEAGHITRKLEVRDAWLPITESKKGNGYYSAFHSLCSGIGFQVLLLPVAFSFLGWIWGMLCLCVTFVWQMYTLWLLIQLHESATGILYCRYLHLAKDCFGTRLGTLLVKFPIMYLSGGTCSALIVVGGGSLKLFFEIIRGRKSESKPLTTIEWYLVFVCLAVILSQLPNLNSIAVISLVGGITDVSYCTIIWVVSIVLGRLPQTSYTPVDGGTRINRVLDIVNAISIIASTFRGHNLVLEIQATMPPTPKHPSRIPMWRGVKAAYLLVALCLYPIAIAGFWSYGNKIPHGGILQALFSFHGRRTSPAVLGLTTLLVAVNCLCSFQIYAMPVFDSLEAGYAGKKNKPCPRWLRSGFRALFGAAAFLIAVAFPFLLDLAGLLGGMALPVALAYPCFMWALVKKPAKCSAMWWANWALGCIGMGLSAGLVAGGLWRLIDTGLPVRFFRARDGWELEIKVRG